MLWRVLKNALTLHFCVKNRYLENEEPKVLCIAPAPSISEIPAAEELQRELEKTTANTHKGKISYNKIIESFRLEKTLKIMESNHKPNPTNSC